MDSGLSLFAPTLRPLAEQIATDLRFVCFFVLTASIIVRAARREQFQNDFEGVLGPIITAAVLCGVIATLPTWFNAIRDEFWKHAGCED